jgi:phage baseplate assembly protein W
MSTFIYSDLNQNASTKYSLVVDVESIFQSIGNILSTPIGSRMWSPSFGSETTSLLFDLIDDITAFLLLTLTIDAIEKWEPRVELLLNESSVEPDYDNNLYVVDLRFVIIGLDNETFTFTGNIIPDPVGNSRNCGADKLQGACQ